MEKGRKKILVLSAVILVLLLAAVLLYQLYGSDLSSKYADMPFRVSFLDVGKADCIFMQLDGVNILVDTGYDDNGEEICDYLTEAGVTRINYMILTHSDKDHIGGADIIMDRIQVDQIIQSRNEVDTRQYNEYQEKIVEKNIDVLTPEENHFIAGKNFKVYVYAAEKESYEQDNDYSLAVRVVYGEYSLLLPGDAEEERIEELLALGDELGSNGMKLPRHGIEVKNSTSLLKTVNPQFCVVTCEKKSMVGENILNTLENMGSILYYTCDGTVSIYGDGENLYITQ